MHRASRCCQDPLEVAVSDEEVAVLEEELDPDEDEEALSLELPLAEEEEEDVEEGEGGFDRLGGSFNLDDA